MFLLKKNLTNAVNYEIVTRRTEQMFF